MDRREFLKTGVTGGLALLHAPDELHALLQAIATGLAPRLRATSRLLLTGLAWVGAESPVRGDGVRLRWMSPSLSAQDGRYGPLPSAFLVERARVREKAAIAEMWGRIDVGSRPTSQAPRAWWAAGLTKRDELPPVFAPVQSPVQAVTFVYHGPRALCLVRDPRRDPISILDVKDGARVYFEAAEIADVTFLDVRAGRIRLSDAATLDLFSEEGRSLEFEEVARVDAAYFRNPASALPAERLDGVTTLTDEDWRAFTELGQAAAPELRPPRGDAATGRIGARDVLGLVTAVRWEYAVLTGFGFLDGPRTAAARLDSLVEAKLLRGVPDAPQVYRVRELGDRGRPPARPSPLVSNLLVVGGGPAAPLDPPRSLRYENSTVSSSVDPERVDASGLSVPLYLAHTRVTWRCEDVDSIAIELTERVSDSPATKRRGWTDTRLVYANSRFPGGRSGSQRRSIELPFPDVTLAAEARSVDAWDRRSQQVSAPTLSFDVDISPQPPPVRGCVVEEASNPRIVHLDRDAAAPAWIPDEVLSILGGELRAYRRVRGPEEREVTASAPVRVDVGAVQTTVTGVDPAALPSFVEGTFSRGDFLAHVMGASGTVLTLEPLDDPDPETGTELLFDGGPALLVQPAAHSDLWTEVAVIAAPLASLPQRLTFADTGLGVPTDVETVRYCIAVTYTALDGSRRRGPFGNPVHVARVPAVPGAAPAFSIERLGRDYYGRATLRIELANAALPSDRFTVEWAPGPASGYGAAGAFCAAAGRGLLGEQVPVRGRVLFEVLELGALARGERITVGMRRTTRSGQAGSYHLVEHVL